MIVGFTNGCFDLLHEGHLYFLKECRRYCDTLTVGLNGDFSVRLLKGEGRPIQPFKKRQSALLRLPSVSYVGMFDGEDALRSLIESVKPDIIFKGSDYEGKEVVGSDLARVVLIPRLEGYSTSAEIAKRRA